MTNLRCDICGFQANTPQGLAGHRQFKHSGPGPVEHASSKHASGEHTQPARGQLESPAHSNDLVVKRLLDRLEEAENSVKTFRRRIEELEQQVHSLVSPPEDCLGRLVTLDHCCPR